MIGWKKWAAPMCVWLLLLLWATSFIEVVTWWQYILVNAIIWIAVVLSAIGLYFVLLFRRFVDKK